MPSTISFEPWRSSALVRAGWVGLHGGALQTKRIRYGNDLLDLEAVRHETGDGVAWDVSATFKQNGKRVAQGQHAGTTRSQAVAGAVEACISAFFNQR